MKMDWFFQVGQFIQKTHKQHLFICYMIFIQAHLFFILHTGLPD